MCCLLYRWRRCLVICHEFTQPDWNVEFDSLHGKDWVWSVINLISQVKLGYDSAVIDPSYKYTSSVESYLSVGLSLKQKSDWITVSAWSIFMKIVLFICWLPEFMMRYIFAYLRILFQWIKISLYVLVENGLHILKWA